MGFCHFSEGVTLMQAVHDVLSSSSEDEELSLKVSDDLEEGEDDEKATFLLVPYGGSSDKGMGVCSPLLKKKVFDFKVKEKQGGGH